MKTIGIYLKSSRLEQKLTLLEVEKRTKIKIDFLRAVESQEWNKLPEYPVLLGFVKNLAQAYGIDKDQATALLRRDYPPRKLPINPKPDLKKDLSWSPKLTFLLGVTIVILAVIGYLVFQYLRFVSPPKLEVHVPTEGQVLSGSSLIVKGETDDEATVSVNNQPAFVDKEGNFSTEIEISKDLREIIFKASSRSGKETIVVRTVEYKSE